jgi:hypothetical protein
MKIEKAIRMLKVDEDGNLDPVLIMEFYPDAVENGVVNYEKLVPVLIAAVNELDYRITSLHEGPLREIYEQLEQLRQGFTVVK